MADRAPPIDFYFDFASPYGYFASTQIDSLAARHGRSVAWRPYLMGVAMKITGARPIPERDMVRDYGLRDMYRSARRLGIGFRLPEPFPVATVGACRVYYWLHERDPEQATALARALFRAYFCEGRNIGEREVVAEVAEGVGAGRAAALAAMQEPRLKERLRQETDAAIARGVFGSPFVVVDGEPFWGHDRLADVERWLESGGW